MSNRPSRSSGPGVGLGVVGALAVVLCCAAPALIAGGFLASLGAVLGSPWLWASALAVAVVAALVVLRHRPTAGEPFGTNTTTDDRRGVDDGPARR